ncbi:MAG: hypothetical protein KGD61_02120 [Candidatus Lokiarchaeota archaeon]|nr:hypothetical protein [Candidatus Lokiarchaeota archaeon]
MLKTKIKRFEFGINVIILVLFAIAAGLSLVSAYGASCVAWDPTYWARIIYMPSPPFPPGTIATIMFEYMGTFGTLFQVMNVITWVTSFITAALIFLYLTGMLGRATWFIALGNSLLAFIAGLIPAIIADTNGFTEPFEMGSPHWAKTVVNGMVLFVLIIVIVLDLIKVTSFKSFTQKDNRFTGNVGRQLVLISVIFLWLSAISFLGTSFMADAHVVGGINVWELIEIQSIGGYITLFGGVSTLSAGLIYNQIKPPTFIK